MWAHAPKNWLAGASSGRMPTAPLRLRMVEPFLDASRLVLCPIVDLRTHTSVRVWSSQR